MANSDVALPHPAGLRHHFDDAEQQLESSTLGMWIFLATEIMFFGGMFCSYMIYRNAYPEAFASTSHFMNVTIGAINGYAVGGGWSWALAFDFCLAVEAAEFWVPEVDMQVPYRGAPAKVLAARLGPWRAKEAILMCRHYDAAELLALGVINRVVQPNELMPAAQELARSMAAKPAKAIANSKRDINAVFFGQRLF